MADPAGRRVPKSGIGYGAFIGIAASAVVIFTILIVNQFEIYERERWVSPSGEAQSNNFYILGKWLSETGHPVRFTPRWAGMKDISPQEGGLFVQASLFDWEHEDLLSWVQEGGVLVVSIDFPLYWRSEAGGEVSASVLAMERFLEKLGVRVRRPLPNDSGAGGDPVDEGRENIITAQDNKDSNAADKADREDKADKEDSVAGDDITEDKDLIAAGKDKGGTVEDEESPVSRGFPRYDYRIIFEDPSPIAGEPLISGGQGNPPDGRPDQRLDQQLDQRPDQRSLTLRDMAGNIRLIRRTLGKGQVAVAGSCIFMYNYLLDNNANARLAWELTGGSLGSERPGFLFVRGRSGAEGLFGILGDRGNLLPPILSCLALVFAGFWVTLPGFGVPVREESRKRLSIIGRFSAEARFLRRYDALRVYPEIYLRELRRLSRGRELGQEIKEVEEALGSGKRIGPRKTAVYLKNLMSALERI